MLGSPVERPVTSTGRPKFGERLSRAFRENFQPIVQEPADFYLAGFVPIDVGGLPVL